jgi:hypothetical protein
MLSTRCCASLLWAGEVCRASAALALIRAPRGLRRQREYALGAPEELEQMDREKRIYWPPGGSGGRRRSGIATI